MTTNLSEFLLGSFFSLEDVLMLLEMEKDDVVRHALKLDELSLAFVCLRDHLHVETRSRKERQKEQIRVALTRDMIKKKQKSYK